MIFYNKLNFTMTALTLTSENWSNILISLWIRKNSLKSWRMIFSTDFEVCLSSAFQTRLVRSVCVKIIDFSGIISANLNDTKQTIQYTIKKRDTYLNKRKIYKGLFFVLKRSLAENIYFHQIIWRNINED